uniref:disabled homolog 2-like isoform X2 n=1 Tax=Ciona intestinalis TaxID=7719 RepID=UPI000180C65D|nr:disabled homolog 2-like isoform X2 [Ciona intestinalis]|eukprot:XP_026690350.1 disabled homolog 2-like isoform X2 [Ciona intestinalis]
MAETGNAPENNSETHTSVNLGVEKKEVLDATTPDPGDRFRGNGSSFKAKLIGVDDVPDSRGDQMCQESILKLKAVVKASGQHKTKIIVNVSLAGLKIIDISTGTILHTHPVHRISFIARDLTDRRAFGYIFGVETGKHQFFGIKTAKAAETLVLTLRDLFQVVYDMKKKEMEEKQDQSEEVYAVPSNRPINHVDQPPQNNDIVNLKQELHNIHQMSELDAFNPWPDNVPTSPDTPVSPSAEPDMFGMSDQNVPKRNASYSNDLEALSLNAVQPAPNPGAKLTKDQILASFQQGNAQQNPAQFFNVQQQQPVFSVQQQQQQQQQQPVFGVQQQQQQQQQPAFGVQQQQNPAYGIQQSMYAGQKAGNLSMPSQPYAQPAVAPAFPSGPAPNIPVRTGAMQPPNFSVQGGAPQNPFGDPFLSSPDPILAPVNQIPDSLNPQADKKEKPDPFASLIPGMGSSAASNKKDMFKNFQMSKPAPPPRSNESVSPNFDSYLRNSVGGVPVDTDGLTAPTPTPRTNIGAPITNSNSVPDFQNDPFASINSTLTNGSQDLFMNQNSLFE